MSAQEIRRHPVFKGIDRSQWRHQFQAVTYESMVTLENRRKSALVLARSLDDQGNSMVLYRSSHGGYFLEQSDTKQILRLQLIEDEIVWCLITLLQKHQLSNQETVLSFNMNRG
jgi:hypothetical protein